MIRLKPEPKNAASAKDKQVRPDAKVSATPVAVSETPKVVPKRAKQTGIRGGIARVDKAVAPIKPKRDRAKYMQDYRRKQIAELKRLRELVKDGK